MAKMTRREQRYPDPLYLLPDASIHHVYPQFGRGHVTNSRDKCWCRPKVEFVTRETASHENEIIGAIIIHEPEQ